MIEHHIVPKGWRSGQFMFNFLAWLKTTKGYAAPMESPECRMADPFHISNDNWTKLLTEYCKSLQP